MNKNLYFKTNQFNCNIELAEYVYAELGKAGIDAQKPACEDFMCSIEIDIESTKVVLYMGKNDEDVTPSLWQIWPEQQVPFFKRLLRKGGNDAEITAAQILERIVTTMHGVSSVEWAV